MKKLSLLLMVAIAVSFASAADVAGWEAFVIRNASTGGTAPTITDLSTGYKQFDVELSGQKAGWGTNLANGLTVGDIQAFSIDRDSSLDSTVYGPYINIWVTDGQGGYACLANEPSHTGEWGTSGPHNTTWNILQNATSWVYEVSATAGFVLPDNTTTTSNLGAGTTDPFTFADFADYVIAVPTTPWGGGGAPDDLNAATYTAYGFNWIFGDSQSNYVGQYPVANPSLTVVPEPATLALLGLGGLLLRKRK